MVQWVKSLPEFISPESGYEVRNVSSIVEAETGNTLGKLDG